MDCVNVGNLIKDLRKEKGMTQLQLGDAMHISDKTVSKWERGLGCPDVSLLPELSLILGVNIERILTGELEPAGPNGGNMKRLKFYVCPFCGNVMTAIGEAEISCCGRKLAPLMPQKADEEHMLKVGQIENDCYITFDHEMKKEHYISFVAYVSYDKVLLVKLYPEQGSELRFPQMSGGKIYYYCSSHGFWVL
ncbi:helix-turn-helix domain-containing protein [Bacillota bacterium]